MDPGTLILSSSRPNPNPNPNPHGLSPATNATAGIREPSGADCGNPLAAQAVLDQMNKTKWTARAGVKGDELGGDSDDDGAIHG